ncbi:hypothetical protein H5410_036718 [Solanum commersonii]|uniref:Uncharacterized protein n=1 Tax=Solanum commersonii TaxID=4109 RepID=A0A9J5Y905_SOLCO|nr:hypothetical protein H5410_036718 [Solanum commersonii]
MVAELSLSSSTIAVVGVGKDGGGGDDWRYRSLPYVLHHVEASALSKVLSQISVLGSAFLALLAVGPAVIEQATPHCFPRLCRHISAYSCWLCYRHCKESTSCEFIVFIYLILSFR